MRVQNRPPLRAIVERWGAVAANAEPAATTATDPQNSSAAKPPAEPSRPAAPPEDDPINMSRLLDFTGGDRDNLRELVALYLSQTGEQLAQIKAAVQAGEVQEVRRLAHSCAGASATCGIRRLVVLLRELEREGFEGKLTSAPQLSQQAGEEFERIRHFLEAYLAEHDTPAGKG